MVVYDVEIVRAVLGPDETKVAGLEYAAGWTDLDNLGIAVICAFDLQTGRYRVFLQDNLDEFVTLISERRFVAGYNNQRLDDRLLEVNGLWPVDMTSYDLLREIWIAAGADPDAPFDRTKQGGLGLDAMARANRVGSKVTKENIAVLWQRGHKGKVIDHCLNDVRLTLLLMAQLQRQGYLLDSRSVDRKLWVKPPFSNDSAAAAHLAALAVQPAS
ncbi:MAG: hypothetical protein RMM17_00920 [Acidobacteriota bacterium]|nr:hypothetical protein [Blastocatellia bacterium]MDW8411229.1 hypothetical protein [Acidobacteriota bacterium]